MEQQRKRDGGLGHLPSIRGQNVTGLQMGGFRGEIVGCQLKEARFEEPRGAAPFLREARARERTATYKNGYSNTTEAKKNNQG